MHGVGALVGGVQCKLVPAVCVKLVIQTNVETSTIECNKVQLSTTEQHQLRTTSEDQHQ